jgi:hypothetical protein
MSPERYTVQTGLSGLAAAPSDVLCCTLWTNRTGLDHDMDAGLAPRYLAWYSPGRLGTPEKSSAGAKWG